MVKLNSRNGYLTLFLQNYNIWRDHKILHGAKDLTHVVNDDKGSPCYSYLEVDLINQDPGEVIFIDCLGEGLHCINFFKQFRSDRHYIIFSNGWWDKDKISLPFTYDLIQQYFYLFEIADTHLSPNRFCFYFDKNYVIETKPNIFVALIGNVRSERDLIVDVILQNICYDNYILRYSGQDLAVKSDHLDLINFDPGQFDPYININEKYFYSVSNTLPVELFNAAYVNLVVESDLDLQNQFFLTEKNIKPLLTGQPFITVATPHFLRHLRQMGFTTYGNLWDESYDDIIDFESRVHAIVKLCNDLKNFDWGKNLDALELIKLKNRNNFFNINKLAGKSFEEFDRILKLRVEST